jgi:hypothetical protein
MSLALVRSHLLSHGVTRKNDVAAPRVLLTAWTRDSTVRMVQTRFPWSSKPLDNRSGAAINVDEHLIANSNEMDVRRLSIADVIIREGGYSAAADVFAEFPGCMIAAVVGSGDCCAVACRDGWSADVAGQSDCAAISHETFGWYASFAHVWVASGRSPSSLTGAYVTITGDTIGGTVALHCRGSVSSGPSRDMRPAR